MKTFRLLGAALFAVLAVGVVAAASASAAVEFLPAEWLISGNAITAKTASEAIGSLSLEDTKTAIGAVAVLCEGSLQGTIGPGGEDEIVGALNTAHEPIGEPLVGLALECAEETGSCPKALVWPENLPWKTLAELMVDNGNEEFFVDLLENGGKGNPAWEIECMGFIPATDLCEVLTVAISELLNLPEDVGAEFSEAFTELALLELAECTQSKEHTGIIRTPEEGLIVLAGGGTLSVSS